MLRYAPLSKARCLAVRGFMTKARLLEVSQIKPYVPTAVWKPAARTVRLLSEEGRRHRRLQQLNLTQLAQEFGTDKWGSHYYTTHYQRHLQHLKDESFTLLEVGIGGYKESGVGGESLQMWKWFFPRARIVGLDIEDKAFVRQPRVHTVHGSQTEPEVLERTIRLHGVPRVVIDDGSHVPADVIATFRHLFPRLPDGAIYAIEDTQTSYWPEFGGQADPAAGDTSMALVKGLVDGLNHEEFVDQDYRPTYTDLHVRSVTCYHNLVFIEKGDNREGTNRHMVLPPPESPSAVG